MISKYINGAALAPRYPNVARYTELVSTTALTAFLAVRNSPVIFQAYVPKRVELRVTVVGRKVFAAEIDSQKSRHSRVDWRRYDLLTTPYRAHQLPAEIEQRCRALLDRLGLSYGAIDLVLTPDGRYLFLEIYPEDQGTLLGARRAEPGWSPSAPPPLPAAVGATAEPTPEDGLLAVLAAAHSVDVYSLTVS